MKKKYTITLLILILLTVPQVLPAQGLADDPPAALKPVTELLKPDGTLDLTTGFHGSLDMSGYRMDTGPNGLPLMHPDLARQSDPITIGRGTLQNTPSADDNFWASGFHLGGINDGRVFSLAVIGSDLYAGGNFTIAGETAANYVARWDGENWTALGTGLNGTVWALTVKGDTLYAGGDFTRAGGKEANFIAMWHQNSWSDLDWGLNGTVLALAIAGNDLYAGGFFNIAGDSEAHNIARWDGSAWSALGTGINGGVYALAIIPNGTGRGDLFAGGEFNRAGGTLVNGISRWNGTSWSALGSGMGGNHPFVLSLAVMGSDLYAGGMFTTAGGTQANRIAKWNGSSWSSLGSGMSITGNLVPYVMALEVGGSALYAAGVFTQAGGMPANRIAKWDGSSWSSLGSGMNNTVFTLASVGGDLYAAGPFTTAGEVTTNHIAKWNGDIWLVPGIRGLGLNDAVYALAVMGSDLYAGGSFTAAGELSANHIAKWDGEGWTALGQGLNGTVYALAVNGNTLFAAGDFTTAGGTPANSIALWDGENWSALGSGITGRVFALTVMGNDLYAGGYFSSAGTISDTGIAKWDGQNWSSPGSGIPNYVLALAVSGTDLYAAGRFTSAGGTPANRIAKWDGASWTALGSGIGGDVLNLSVSALAVMGNVLYAGGVFNIAGDSEARNIAKWDGSAWSALGTGLGDTDYPQVHHLAVIGSNLYAGGFFTTSGETEAANLAKWDGSNWSAPGSGVNDIVRALAFSGNHLYVGGLFTIAGEKSSGRIARWDKPFAAAAVTRTLITPQTDPVSFNEPDAVTGVSIQITKASGGPTMHVLRYNDAPENPAGIAQNVSPFRWIIQQTALAPFPNATIRFKLPDIPNHGITNAGSLTVYSRSTPGSGTFYMNATRYDQHTDELVAEDISDFGEFAFGNITVNLEEPGGIPVSYRLLQNYPNPFNPSTVIRYTLPEQSRVKLDVFNTLGQHVATLFDGIREAGNHQTAFDAARLPGGLYICRMQAGDYSETIKMLLIK